jgi:hypothetical protein
MNKDVREKRNLEYNNLDSNLLMGRMRTSGNISIFVLY